MRFAPTSVRKIRNVTNMSNKVVINSQFGGFRLSDEAIEFLREKGLTEKKLRLYLWGNIPRHDELLVEVVEALGKLAARKGSVLVVENIPGTKYTIHETDGAEKLYFPEMEWRVEIN